MPARREQRHVSPTSRPRGPLLVALCTALLLLLLASAASAGTTFTITGRGWGHGVGMSQWGAYGLAKQGKGYREILQHYFTGIGFKTIDNPIVRVRLRSGLGAARLTCDAAYTVQGSAKPFTIPAKTAATITYASGRYRVVAGSWSRSFSSAVTFTPSKGNLRVLTASDIGKTGAYRGTVRIVRVDGRLMIVNHVPMESYLRGVISREVDPDWPAEVLKAQACAARSEAEWNRRAKKANWDVYCDWHTQVYGGVGYEAKRTDAAIVATAGIVPAYNGTAILAVYFDCSGGQTEDVKNVWGGDYPYLKAVDDPTDEVAPLHTWGPLRRSAAQLTAALGSSCKGTLKAITVTKRGKSPRIVWANVVGSGGTTKVSGDTLRWQLGLNSTWATFKSMSAASSANARPALAKGDAVTLSGRLYPALTDGATVTLRYRKAGGDWQTRAVATERHTERLADGSTAAYSAYAVALKPGSTTEYSFASGSARSPVTTVTVR